MKTNVRKHLRRTRRKIAVVRRHGRRIKRKNYSAIDISGFQDQQEAMKGKKDQTRIIMVPIEEAYKLRDWSEDGMTPKRSDTTMHQIEQEIRGGWKYPIDTDEWEFKEGRLSDGKHRIIVAKQLGLKEVPVRLHKYI